MSLLDILLLETSAGGAGDGGSGESSQEEETQAPQEGDAGPGGQEPEVVPRSELAKANREAQKYRKELREAQAKIADFESLSKTEQEKAAEKAKEAENRAADLALQNRQLRVRVLAPSVGIADPSAASDAASLLDWSTVTDPDSDEDIKSGLEELVKSRPYLRSGSREGADGGAGGGTTTESVNMNDMLRRAAGRA